MANSLKPKVLFRLKMKLLILGLALTLTLFGDVHSGRVKLGAGCKNVQIGAGGCSEIYETALLKMINQVRANHGAQPLKLNTEIAKKSQVSLSIALNCLCNSI